MARNIIQEVHNLLNKTKGYIDLPFISFVILTFILVRKQYYRQMSNFTATPVYHGKIKLPIDEMMIMPTLY
jgi:hypothetical protein